MYRLRYILSCNIRSGQLRIVLFRRYERVSVSDIYGGPSREQAGGYAPTRRSWPGVSTRVTEKLHIRDGRGF